MSGARSGDRAYARAVERALSRWSGRSVVLSPRDFELLSRWQEAGVPLATVLAAINAAGRRARGSLTLAHVSRAVGEAWEVIRSGRAPETGSGGALSLQDARRRWLATSEVASAETAVGPVLADLVRRLDAGEDPEELDRELDRKLLHAAGAERLAAAEQSAQARLARRLGPGRHAEPDSVRRAVIDELRRALELPRLSHCRDERAASGPAKG